MKKILIATVLIFTTGIISSCLKQNDIISKAGHTTQLIVTSEKKDLGSAD